MTEPRVSVIVPAHNAEGTIEASLGSLAEQTSRDFEVVLVDDGSTDGTAALVERFEDGFPVPLALVRQEQGGRADARNTGVAEARGEFLAFVDADDIAEPTMIERLLGRADASGADLVVCEYAGVDADTGEVLHHYREGAAALYGASVLERPGLLSATVGSVCNKLVRRSLFADGAIDFPTGKDFEDLAVSYRLVGQARRVEKVAEVLYRYRHGQPASVMGACDERYLDIFDALEVTNEHFKRAGTFDALRSDLVVINYMHLITGRYDDLFSYGAPELRHEFIRRAFAHMHRYFPGWRLNAAVRAASGRLAKHLVSTNRLLLTAYTDRKARERR